MKNRYIYIFLLISFLYSEKLNAQADSIMKTHVSSFYIDQRLPVYPSATQLPAYIYFQLPFVPSIDSLNTRIAFFDLLGVPKVSFPIKRDDEVYISENDSLVPGIYIYEIRRNKKVITCGKLTIF